MLKLDYKLISHGKTLYTFTIMFIALFFSTLSTALLTWYFEGKINFYIVKLALLVPSLVATPLVIRASFLLTDLMKAEKTIAQQNTLLNTQLTQLKDAQQKAQINDQLKTAFLSNITHEIRTPLTSVIGFSTLLNTGDYNETEKNQFLNIIQQNGQHLLSLFNDILDISQLDSRQIHLEKKSILIKPFLEELYQFFLQLYLPAANPHISFQLELPDNMENLTLFTDPYRLRQIYFKLLSNSFKFTKKGQISLGIIPSSNNHLDFFVSDTGIGIPDSQQELVFQKFFKADNSTTRAFEGAGTGLAIAKGLIELLGGEIHIKSSPGKGTTFIFSHPIS